jgi:hypothetical protein
VVDPNADDPKTTVDVGAIAQALYAGPAAAIAALQAFIPTCNFQPPEPTGEIKKTTPAKCCACENNDIRYFNRVEGSVGIEIPEFSCAIPGLGFQYNDWFFIGISGFASGLVTVGMSYELDPCNTNSPIICVTGSAEGTLGFRAGGTINIRACTVDVRGQVSATGSISGSACIPPGDGADLLFTLEPLTLTGSCTVKTLFITCEKRLFTIYLSRKIEVPVHLSPIAL